MIISASIFIVHLNKEREVHIESAKAIYQTSFYNDSIRHVERNRHFDIIDSLKAEIRALKGEE